MRIVQTSCIIRIEPNTSTRSMLIAYSSLTYLLMRHAGSPFVEGFAFPTWNGIVSSFLVKSCLFLYFKNIFKKINFFLFLINIFLVFLNYFDVLIKFRI